MPLSPILQGGGQKKHQMWEHDITWGIPKLGIGVTQHAPTPARYSACATGNMLCDRLEADGSMMDQKVESSPQASSGFRVSERVEYGSRVYHWGRPGTPALCSILFGF